MQTRHRMVSACLTAGVPVAQQASNADVDRFTAICGRADGAPAGPGRLGRRRRFLLPDDLEEIVACFSPGVSDCGAI